MGYYSALKRNDLACHEITEEPGTILTERSQLKKLMVSQPAIRHSGKDSAMEE
jgi:hypothetical protein